MVVENHDSKWRYLTFSQSHPGKVRSHNEDACMDCADIGLWLVADGMGGHKAGDVASQMLVAVVQRAVDSIPLNLLCIDDLYRALNDANKAIFDYSQRYLNGETIGTTGVILFLKNGFYHCLWVGDSRLYLYRQNQLIQKTRDHSQVMEMVEQGLIQADEAENHPMANVITRAIGVHPHVTIDQLSGELVRGDLFLLCSDGLTKELSDKQISKCLQAHYVKDAGLALMHSALVKGASDNVTCVLVRDSKVGGDDKERPESDDTVPIFTRTRN